MLAGLAGGGTWAIFSDTEISTGNTLAAGTLNLKVGSADPCTESIAVSNIKPTDTGHAASWAIRNTGTISGSFSLSFSAIDNQENGRSEVETACGDTSDGAGELGGKLTIAVWMDVGNNGWGSGDYYFEPSGPNLIKRSYSSFPTLAYFTLADFDNTSSASLQTIAASTTAGNFKVDYDFPEGGSNDNTAQSDSCIFDVTFNLDQL
jgi:spore coat-associated protein N